MKAEFELENFRKFVRDSDGKFMQSLLSLLSEADEFTDRQFALLLRQEMLEHQMLERMWTCRHILSSGE